jgi:hypothetical protein
MTPDLAAAASRLDGLFVDDHAVGSDALAQFELPLPDPRGRAELRAEADRRARNAGRGELLDQAVEAARERADRRHVAAAYRPTWIVLNWGQSLGRARAWTAYALALEDAAVAAVVDDLLDETDIAELTWGFDRVRGLADGRASVGSLERDVTTRHRGLRWLLGSLFAGAMVFSLWSVSFALDPSDAVLPVLQGAIAIGVLIRLAAPVDPGPTLSPDA